MAFEIQFLDQVRLIMNRSYHVFYSVMLKYFLPLERKTLGNTADENLLFVIKQFGNDVQPFITCLIFAGIRSTFYSA